MSAVDDVTLRSATEADARGIRVLLEGSGLPTSDLRTARPDFVIADSGGRIIGAGAVERFGSAGLLRSVAVEAQWRGSGVGSRIVQELEERARTGGISELVLLTLTARNFFERLGYRAKSREQVSASLLESTEFRSLCPASAACMAKTLLPK